MKQKGPGNISSVPAFGYLNFIHPSAPTLRRLAGSLRGATRLLIPRLLAGARLERLVHLRRARLLDEVLAGAKPCGRPRARCPRLAGRVAVHHVDALEREVRGLVQEEVDDHRAREVARREHEPVSVVDRARDERREEREEEVPQPVARGRERGLTGTGARREGLADEDPDTAVFGSA